MSNWIYYIACPETLRVKIGFTSGNVFARLKALQTGSPSKLLLIACHPGTMAHERELHDRFAEHRLHGEWFEMSEQLLEHISMVVWLAACDAVNSGKPLERWVKVGLQSMHEEHPLPENMAALL